MLDDVGAFAGAVSDEEAWALLEVFCEAVFVDDGWGGFCLLAGEIPGQAGDDVIARDVDVIAGLTGNLKDGGVDFHAAGVDHRDDEAGIPGQGEIPGQSEIPGQAGDDCGQAGDDCGRTRLDVITTLAFVIAGLTGNLCGGLTGNRCGGLGDEGVEGADGEEGFAGAEAEAFGCGYSHAEAGI